MTSPQPFTPGQRVRDREGMEGEVLGMSHDEAIGWSVKASFAGTAFWYLAKDLEPVEVSDG
jgi:hypothetical protein